MKWAKNSSWIVIQGDPYGGSKFFKIKHVFFYFSFIGLSSQCHFKHCFQIIYVTHAFYEFQWLRKRTIGMPLESHKGFSPNFASNIKQI